VNDSDKPIFQETINAVSEMLGRELLTATALKLYFSLLSEFTIEEVQHGLKQHLKGETGQYMPKPADIIKHLNGKEMSYEAIVAGARNPIKPVDVLARIHIGSFDLNRGEPFYLRERAAEIKAILPKWKERARAGDFSDQELRIMAKYKVNPQEQFMLGMAPVEVPGLKERFIAIAQQQQDKENEQQLRLENERAGVEKHAPEEIAKAKEKLKEFTGGNKV